jgi:hypothetical protein
MHGGKSRRGIAHPRYKDGKHCVNPLFPIRVAWCPKCRRKHGSEAERERRQRAMSAKYFQGYTMGRLHGYREGWHAGFNAGEDAAYKKMARKAQDRTIKS